MGLISSFLLGYHGCNATIAQRLLDGKPFRKSVNEYDWLGHGAYFWEANPRRAVAWAHDHAPARQPCVVGAVIDPGECLDMFSAAGIEAASDAYESLRRSMERSGRPLPCNSGGSDLLNRRLDCAVIEHLCEIVTRKFDTVRGIFREGEPIYPNAGFFKGTHIQICVRNLDCIKGVFRVPAEQLA